MKPALDPVAIETHSLVVATFALVKATLWMAGAAFLGVIVPPILTAFGVRRQRRVAVAELRSVVAIFEQRLEAIISGKGRIYGAGTGITALCARVFSNDIAAALGQQSLAEVYRSVTDASEVISSYGAFIQNAGPIIMGGGSTPSGVAEHFSRDARKKSITTAAQQTLNDLRAAMRSLEGRSAPPRLAPGANERADINDSIREQVQPADQP